MQSQMLEMGQLETMFYLEHIQVYSPKKNAIKRAKI